jgi:tetratricopeptide (TPR) repeat protein
MQKLDLAQKDLEKFLTYDDKDVVVLHNLAMLYMRTGQLPKSLDAFNKAIAIKPEAAMLFSRRAQVHELMGNMAAAANDKAQADQLRASKRANDDLEKK